MKKMFLLGLMALMVTCGEKSAKNHKLLLFPN